MDPKVSITVSFHEIISEPIFLPSLYHPCRWSILSLIDGLRLHMLTTANEIGGVDASSEKRRKLAEHSRLWRLGPIDHGKMVRCGLFCDEMEEVGTVDDLVLGQAIKQVPQISSQPQTLKSRRDLDEIPDRMGSGAQVRKRRTLGETVIIIMLRTIFMLLKSPVRVAILVFALFTLILRPVPVNSPQDFFSLD